MFLAPVYHLFLLRLRKMETAHASGFMADSMVNQWGSFHLALSCIHHLRISMEGGDGKYAWQD